MNSGKRNNKNYKCKICNKLFQKPSLLKRHEIGHSNIKPFQCNECNQRFTQKSSLDRHQSNVHLKLKQFPCPKCDIRFSQHSNLVTHVKRLHNPNKVNALKEEPVMNSICNDDSLEITTENIIRELKNLQNIQFNNLEDSLLNNYVVPKDKNYSPEGIRDISETSEKLVEIIDNLDNEKKVRTIKQIIQDENKWFECNLCSKKFRRSHDLLRHFRSHTREKNFECDICKKRFALKCTLRIHMKAHKSIRNNKTSKNKSYDEKKINNNGNNIQTYKIHKANNKGISLENTEKFNCENQLILTEDRLQIPKIINKVESRRKKLTCEICRKYFKKPIDLKRHILTHTKEKMFSCEECEKTFALKCTLKDHMKIHSENRVKVECQICGKKYTNKSVLKVHIRIHFNELPYKCDHKTCTKAFRTIGHKKQHLKQHKKK